MTLTDISLETWLVLAGLGVLLLVMLVVWLRPRRGADDTVDARELDRLREERDDWRQRQEEAASELAAAREALARLDGVVEERNALRAKLETVSEAHNALNARHESLKAEHEAAQRHHGEKLAELEKARERLSEQFKLTANEILKTSGAELNKQSTENLQTLLKPLREQLSDFRTKVETDAKERHGHAGEIKQLMETVRKDAARMSDDAQKLANALRSSSKVQGDWGELVLARILESSGLREGHEFHTQKSETLEDGSRLRPDIVVDLPGGHRLVIDSKVSLKAFDQCVNAETEEERGLALKQHIQSVRNHVNALGAKDYGQLYTGVSFTLMFIPLEGAASLALQNDVNISVDAAERDVMIATPTTLMMAMRTIGNLWTVDRQNRNALDIADRAGKLFDKFHGFVSDLEEIGQRLNQAETAWSHAKGKLIDGPGNLVGQAQKLKDLGAKTRKSLPAEYLDAAGVEETDDTSRPALTAPEAVDS